MNTAWPRRTRPPGAPLVAPRARTLWRRRSLRVRLFLLFNLLYGVVFALPLAHLYAWSRHQPHAPHVGLVLLGMLLLLPRHRQALGARAACSVGGGLLLGVGGGLCYLLGLHPPLPLSPNDGVTLTTLGLVTLWLGGFVTCFGFAGLRAVRGPLGFLVFAIPVPDVLLAPVITALQAASAEVTAVLFTLVAQPFVREGFTFALPGLTIEVARECSGIRSSLSLLLTGLLASQLWLHRWWSHTVVVLLVYPLAVGTNGLRIVTLCLLTLDIDAGFMTGELHAKGGAVFFALALALLLLLLGGLRTLEAGQGRPQR
jgi:exosortase